MGNTKNNQPNSIRNAKLLSQIFVKYIAHGIASKLEINIMTKVSVNNNDEIFVTDDPNVLRTPISFVRNLIEWYDKPNKPRHAIKMAMKVNRVNNLPN